MKELEVSLNKRMSILEKPAARIVIGLVLVGLFALLVYLATKEKLPEPTPLSEPALSEKEQVLQSLSAPPDAKSILQGEEGKQVLDSLSVPPNAKSIFGEEERNELSKSLSAPPDAKSILAE